MINNSTKMERHVGSLMENVHRENALNSLKTLGKVIEDTRDVLLKWKKENERIRNLIETSAKTEAELLNNNYQSNNVKEGK